jgi:threonine dehydrogenase-like Zn-dependent dehydrogenase
LKKEPIVLGHECSVTVVKAGKQWKDNFKKGDRFIVQADIYYNGVGYAFGYLIPGGMEQYTYLDERVLAGDDGCYLLPVQPTTGLVLRIGRAMGLCRNVVSLKDKSL